MRGWVVAFLALCVWLPAVTGALRAAEAADDAAKQQQLEALLAGATEDFVAGRHVAARSKLEKLIAVNPTNEEAWRLREAFGDKILREMSLWMIGGQTLGEAPEILLSRALSFDAEKRENQENVARIVKTAVENPRDLKALHELSILGPLAAPWLIDQMRTAADETRQSNANYLLSHLGQPMTLPLSQTLIGLLNEGEWDTDQAVLAQLVTEAMANIRPRDMRALPALKRFAEDTRRVESARAWAARAIEAITGLPAAQTPPAMDLVYSEAQRLYMGGPLVQDEMTDLRGRYFIWNPEFGRRVGSQEVRGFLQSVLLPEFALDDVYTQDLIFAGLSVEAGAASDAAMTMAADNVEVGRFESLLARSLLQQAFEIDEYASVAAQREVVRSDFRRLAADIKTWQSRLWANRHNAWLLGDECLAVALAEAMVDGKSNVALGALDGLGATTTWGRLANRDALLRALEYSDVRVRYKAASMLVKIGAPAELPQMPEIAAILADGATVKTQKVVVLMSANDELRLEMARKLTSRGISVLTASDGTEGLQLAWQAPFKDAVLVDAELEEFGRVRRRLTEAGLIPGTQLPVVVVTTQARADKMREAMAGEADWEVVVRTATPDSADLFKQLVADNTAGQAKLIQTLALVVNENSEAREQIKLRLLTDAESVANPAGVSELLSAMEKMGRQELGGATAPSLRAAYANVFLDEELSSRTAMQVLQALRQDPRSAKLPVALMAGAGRMAETGLDFKEFLAEAPLFRMEQVAVGMGSENDERDADRWSTAVDEMSAVNELVKHDFQKNYFRRSALECAEQLGALPRGGSKLPADKALALREALADAARPVDVRTALARALGAWEEESAARILAGVFRGTAREREDLRLASLWALGEVDRTGSERKTKEDALNVNEESSQAVRDAAAAALGKEYTDAGLRLPLSERQRHNDPMRLLRIARPNERDQLILPASESQEDQQP